MFCLAPVCYRHCTPVNGEIILWSRYLTAAFGNVVQNWHWQVMNDEYVLASGIAESSLAARGAVILQCLQRLANPFGPN
jgi:hypothetical protein